MASKVMGLTDPGFRDRVPHLVTLTYAEDAMWRPHHMAQAMQKFRHWHRKRGFGEAVRYVRVAELTKRGRVHHHLIVWLPQGVSMPQWDRVQTNRDAFWSHGTTQSEPLRTSTAYLMKYLSKMDEGQYFPKGLRVYSVGGLQAAGRCIRSWARLPTWVKRSHGVGQVKRINNRIVDLSTGEILPPMFSRRLVEGALHLQLLRPYPEPFHDGPYSTYPRGNA